MIDEDDKLSLLSAKYQWVITDPYPELSEWDQFSNNGIIGRFFRKTKVKPEISPHKAWMDGFNFAWKLIEQKIKEL